MENEGPYVSFVFQYRSAGKCYTPGFRAFFRAGGDVSCKEILQAMGVMTRTEGNKRRRNDSEELNVGDEPADADGSDVEQAEAEIAALEVRTASGFLSLYANSQLSGLP